MVPPGVWEKEGGNWKKPVGNIFWAGAENSEVWNSYMEGGYLAG
jgi:monoamine oxidase